MDTSLSDAETNECDSDPCMNGGTCRDLHVAFECDCPTFYNGTTCEIGKLIFFVFVNNNCSNLKKYKPWYHVILL